MISTAQKRQSIYLHSYVHWITGYREEAESVHHNIPWTLRTYNPGKAEAKEKNKNQENNKMKMCVSFIQTYVMFTSLLSTADIQKHILKTDS